MTDNFIAYFYRERLVVTVASILIVAGGLFALTRLNVDSFTDVTPVPVEVVATGPRAPNVTRACERISLRSKARPSSYSRSCPT